MRRLGLVMVLALGCGDDDGMPPDLTAPEIVSRTPEAGATNVWVADPITVVFSEAIPADPTIALTRADGTAIAHTASWSTDRITLTVTIDERPPAPQTVGIRISGVADAAGNVMAEASFTWDLPLWQQPGDAVSTGRAAGARVARDSMGRIVVAWQANDQVYARRLDGSTWEALGNTVDSVGQASVPEVAIDGSDRPVVAWVRGEAANGATMVARWDGTAWQALASPGAGSGVALTAAADGTIYVANQGNTGSVGSAEVNVWRLGASDAWESLNGPFSSDGFGTADVPPGISLAVQGTTPIVAWISDVTGVKELRTARLSATGSATSWEVLPKLNLTSTSNARQPHLLVEPSGRIDLAYQETVDASSDARVATLDNDGTWSLIGRQLDVDLLADAGTPGIAADAGGLWAAWVERKGAVYRLWVAREANGAWELVGGQAVNREDRSFAGDPAVALEGGWPFVAWQEWLGNDFMAATIWARRYNGNEVRLPGLATRASTAACTAPTSLGTVMLSQTGCFASLGADPVPMAGLIPFEINSQLWSDGALKRRWLVLPDGGTITRTDAVGWDVPVGTMVIKEFALEMDETDPSSRRPVETRFLVKEDAENNWSGWSFQWDDNFTDAVLLDGSAAVTKDWMIATGDGGTTVHTHTYPSRTQCTTCHNGASGVLLGVRTKQLMRRVDYGGTADDQLQAMDRIGLFSEPLGPLPTDPFTPPSDATYPLESRARGYLAANCSHCHPPIRSTRDMRWETPLASTMLCADNEIVPGDPASSVLFQRMSARPGMPPIATLVTDPFALGLMSAWISGMSSCP